MVSLFKLIKEAKMKNKIEELGTIHYFIISLMLITIITFLLSCSSNSNNPSDNPSGEIVKYSDCKSNIQDSISNSKDCIEYQYDGKSYLKFTHINAGFNCCPGKITANIEIDSNAILVKENEQAAGCYCNCLYDIDYEINNLAPGMYHIVIVEPYKQSDEPLLEFDMDLIGHPTGSFCVDRWHYPWAV
jgi:hypothetical protein